MTTNQTIDGVPRELLERILSYAWFPSGAVEVFDLRLTDREKLRALLEAPAVDPDPIVGVLKNCLSEGVQPTFSGGDLKHLIRILENKPAAQPQGEPVAWDIHWTDNGEFYFTLRNQSRLWKYEQDPDFKVVPLYAEQPAPVALVTPARPNGGL